MSPGSDLAQRQVHVGTFLSQQGTKSESWRSMKTGSLWSLNTHRRKSEKSTLHRSLGTKSSHAPRPDTNVGVDHLMSARGRPLEAPFPLTAGAAADVEPEAVCTLSG